MTEWTIAVAVSAVVLALLLARRSAVVTRWLRRNAARRARDRRQFRRD